MANERNTRIRYNQIASVRPADLDPTNPLEAGFDGYVPSYDLATGQFTWVANAGSGVTASEWNQNGFENLTDSVLAWTDEGPDRTLSIQPTVTSFDYWIAGVKYTSTGDTVQITEVEGVHFIYYDGDTLTALANPTTAQLSTLITEKALVSIIYWNDTDKEGIYIGEERHGKSMSPYTHEYLHFSEGLRYFSGLGLNTIDADQAADDNAHAQFGIDLGIVADEDLVIDISAVISTTGLPVYYMTGATPTWNKETNAGYSVIKTGASAEVRLAYNQYTGGSWQLTEVSDGDFVLCHIFATTEKDTPMIAIVGQNVYTNKPQAQSGALLEIKELILNDILFPEIRPIATVIFQTDDSYSNDMQARIITTSDGDDYIDWRNEEISRVALTTSDHNALSGLQGGEAGQYYHLTSAQLADLTDSGDCSIHKHDDIYYTETEIDNKLDAKFLIGDTSADSALDNEILSINVNPTNLLTNGNFELWSDGTSSAPDGWSLIGSGGTVAREASIIKLGTYSAKVTRSGSTTSLYRTAHTEKGLSYWKGRQITFSCWAYATVADRVRLYLADGDTGALASSFHTGDSTWQLLTITTTIGASATHIYLYAQVRDGDTTAYFDGAMCVEGAMPYAFSPKPSDMLRTAFTESNPTNLITNGDFELWAAGTSVAPSSWVLEGAGASVAAETTTFKVGGYSAALTRSGADCDIYQYYFNRAGSTYWAGRTVTFSCWVYATVADRARIGMYAGSGIWTYSTYHTGDSTWQLLCLTKTMAVGSANQYVTVNVDNGDTTAYFDGAMLVEGSMPYAFSYKPLSEVNPTVVGTLTATTVDINGGAIDGAIIGGTTPAAGTFVNVIASGTVQALSTFQSSSGADVTLNANGANRDVFLKVNGTTIMTMVGSTSAVKTEGTMSLKEQAAANADTAAYGQLWVKTATPNELWFTDDEGTDFQLGASSAVSGIISLWSGAISAIPSGYVICDGNNSTPNLTDRFVIHADADAAGTNDVGDTGGASTHALSTAELASHNHSATFADSASAGQSNITKATGNTSQGTMTVSSAGSGTAHTNRDKYYALAYIMKT